MAPRTPSIPEAQWDDVKSTIRRLYIVEEKDLPTVMTIMKDDHKFEATPRMYKAHFRQWDWRKNASRATMIAAQRRMAQLGRLGKPTVFEIGGHSFTDQQIQQYLKRANEYQPKKPLPAPPQSFLNDIKVSTPPQGIEDNTETSTPPIAEQEDVKASNSPAAEQEQNVPEVMRNSLSPTISSAMYYVLRASLVPSVQSPLRTSEFRTVEELFKTTQDHIIGSFDSGNWYSVDNQVLSKGTITSAQNPKTWSSKLSDCLYDCLYDFDCQRKDRAIGRLATACQLAEFAVMEDNPLLINSLMFRFTERPQIFKETLALRQTLLRHFNGWAGLSRPPTLLQRWSWLVLNCADNYEMMRKLVQFNAEIFKQQLSEEHPDYIRMRYHLLVSLGDDGSNEAWETLIQIAHRARARIGTFIMMRMSQMYLQRGQYEKIEALPPGLYNLNWEQDWQPKVAYAINLAEGQINLGRIDRANETCALISDRLQQVEPMNADALAIAQEFRDILLNLKQFEAAARAQMLVDKINKKLDEDTVTELAKLELGAMAS